VNASGLRLGLGALAALLLLAAPWLLREFHLHLLTEILILALFATAFNLLFGYTGLLSFGQAAYFGVGAYVAALFLKGVVPSLPLAILVAALASGVLAAVIGWLCVRRDEIYFAMVTLAFGQLVFAVLWRWRRVTGGSDGIGGIPRTELGMGPLAVDLARTDAYYYFTLAVVALCLYLIFRITRSPLGLTLKAIRDNPRRVDYLGIPMRRYRLIAFVGAGFFTGVAGALFAPYQGTVAPTLADWIVSAEPVMMTLLGGPGVFLGPAIGAALFLALKETIQVYTDYWPLVLGSAVILLVLFLPRGVAHSLLLWLPRRRRPVAPVVPAGEARR
jgi:branched-chain amino acid transport system permease protein